MSARSQLGLPVSINLREILRVTMNECHIFLGAVGLHPCTEYLKDRLGVTEEQCLDNYGSNDHLVSK